MRTTLIISTTASLTLGTGKAVRLELAVALGPEAITAFILPRFSENERLSVNFNACTPTVPVSIHSGNLFG